MTKLRTKGLSDNYHSLPHTYVSSCAPTSQVIEFICTFREMLYLTHMPSLCTNCAFYSFIYVHIGSYKLALSNMTKSGVLTNAASDLF